MTALRVEKLCCHTRDPESDEPREASAASFEVPAGECLCISGPSGSGKTLLLRAIADLDAASGKIYLGDDERNSFSGPEWRRRVGYMPAEPVWWDRRIRAHFPGRRVRHLKEVGLDLPVLRRDVVRLSTGERQRLALLRLLNRNPEVLLLDEPTASLDAESTLMVEELIECYRREHEVAVVWVSHDGRQRRRVSSAQLRIRNGRLQPVRRRRSAKRKVASKKAGGAAAAAAAAGEAT